MFRPSPLRPLVAHFISISRIWILGIQDLRIQTDPFTDNVNKYVEHIKQKKSDALVEKVNITT
jgi:hypothetical protein